MRQAALVLRREYVDLSVRARHDEGEVNETGIDTAAVKIR